MTEMTKKEARINFILVTIMCSVVIISFSIYYTKYISVYDKHYTLEIKQNPIIKVESISKINVESENGVFTATYEESKGNYKTITFSSEFTIRETEKEGE